MAEDLDHNGIPDSIQRDPVIVPDEPVDEGLPGITAPIDTPIPEGPGTDFEVEQRVTQDKARVANKAADEMDEYLRD